MKIATSLVAAVLLSVHSLAVLAEQGPNLAEQAPPTASSQAVGHLSMAASLVRYGDAHKDAMSLITAARIMRAVGSSESTAEAVSKAEPDTKKVHTNDIPSILARAKQYAGARADLVALADDVAAGSRGAVNGPRRLNTVVRSNTTDVYKVNFRGGETAAVAVSGDGDSDLDLYVYDQNGNQICKDDDYTDDMICRWAPKWTGPFTIRVRNRGMANAYIIVHN